MRRAVLLRISVFPIPICCLNILAALGYEYGCAGLRIWLRWVTDMAALGYEYGCAGLRIWLRWVTDMTALGYEYGCAGLRI